MKKKLSIICLLIFCAMFTGCNFGTNTNGESSGANNNENSSGSSNESNSDENINKYTLLATLDNSVISNYYEASSTIHTADTGAVTFVLNNGFVDAAFRWDLSAYSFKMNTEYLVEFKDLSISGVEPDLSLFLKLQWQDSSYTFLRYYHTDTNTFTTSVDNDHYGLRLDALTYETYSFSFKFNHSGIATSTHNRLYFDFQGIKAGGILSFDSLSIYVPSTE